MPRRARHPHFSHAEQASLLQAMGNVRRAIIYCGSAERHASPRAAKCDAARAAIDALAEDLTGDPQYFWDKPH